MTDPSDPELSRAPQPFEDDSRKLAAFLQARGFMP
jgi:hypothetical protein